MDPRRYQARGALVEGVQGSLVRSMLEQQLHGRGFQEGAGEVEGGAAVDGPVVNRGPGFEESGCRLGCSAAGGEM